MRQVELPAFVSQVAAASSHFLHVCKLPPEENKMVPRVKLQLRGLPLQRPEINFGAFILQERHTMGVR